MTTGSTDDSDESARSGVDVNEQVSPPNPEQVVDRIVDPESARAPLARPDSIGDGLDGCARVIGLVATDPLAETDRRREHREVVVETSEVTLDRRESSVEVSTGHDGTEIGMAYCRLQESHRPRSTVEAVATVRAISTRASTRAMTVSHPGRAHRISVWRERGRIGRESRESTVHPAEMMSKVERTYHATIPSWYPSRGRSVSRMTPLVATPERNSRPACSTS